MVVYKYTLTHGVNNLFLPSGSNLLKVAFQGAEIALWVLIPTQSVAYDDVVIRVAFTGEDFSHDGSVNYISSDEDERGIVIHAFELV